jgi:hypothetical protein
MAWDILVSPILPLPVYGVLLSIGHLSDSYFKDPNSVSGFSASSSPPGSRLRPFPRKIEISPNGGRPLAPSSPIVRGPTTPRSEAGPSSSPHPSATHSSFPPSVYQTHHHMNGFSNAPEFSHPGDFGDDDDDNVHSLSGY